MIDEKIINWLCLSYSKGIGPKTFWAMLKKYGSAEEALKYVKEKFSRDKAIKTLKSINYNVLLADDEKFPVEFKRSSTCPPVLFYQGNLNILKKRKIAIIGARNASIAGTKIARQMASKLSDKFAIVSGLAKGIDANAHLGSLEKTENQSAIAILPFSLENIYPKENEWIYKMIEKNGLLISEVFPYSVPDQGMFQARNRLLSLLSNGIVVVEAGLKSGTMSTVKLALDLGSEIMVVPGSPLDPRYSGSNALIKNGAPLIRDYFDVLEIMDETVNFEERVEPKKFEFNQNNSSEKTKKVLSAISSVPTSLDVISAQTNIEISELLTIITNLEIEGKIIKYYTNEVVLA